MKKGEYRPHQEDRYIAMDRFANSESSGTFAVIDGHGGIRAAEYCRENLGKMLESHEGLDKNTFRALKEVFEKVDNEFLKIAMKKNYCDGATCLLALIRNCKLTIANLGDSVATVIKSGKMIKLTVEQTPSRWDEG